MRFYARAWVCRKHHRSISMSIIWAEIERWISDESVDGIILCANYFFHGGEITANGVQEEVLAGALALGP